MIAKNKNNLSMTDGISLFVDSFKNLANLNLEFSDKMQAYDVCGEDILIKGKNDVFDLSTYRGSAFVFNVTDVVPDDDSCGGVNVIYIPGLETWAMFYDAFFILPEDKGDKVYLAMNDNSWGNCEWFRFDKDAVMKHYTPENLKNLFINEGLINKD